MQRLDIGHVDREHLVDTWQARVPPRLIQVKTRSTRYSPGILEIGGAMNGPFGLALIQGLKNDLEPILSPGCLKNAPGLVRTLMEGCVAQHQFDVAGVPGKDLLEDGVE